MSACMGVCTYTYVCGCVYIIHTHLVKAVTLLIYSRGCCKRIKPNKMAVITVQSFSKGIDWKYFKCIPCNNTVNHENYKSESWSCLKQICCWVNLCYYFVFTKTKTLNSRSGKKYDSINEIWAAIGRNNPNLILNRASIDLQFTVYCCSIFFSFSCTYQMKRMIVQNRKCLENRMCFKCE